MKKLVTFLAIGSFLAMSAAPIMAQDAPQRERRGEGQRGGRLPEEYTKKFDKNGDGKLDEGERAEAMKAYREEQMKKYDKDGDGKLSESERQAMREDMQRNRPQRGQGQGQGGEKKEEKKP